MPNRYVFLSCSQTMWPFFQRYFLCGQVTHAHPPIHNTNTYPCHPLQPLLGAGLGGGGVGDYASGRLVKGLPWSFCCVTDGWEAEQACFAWEEKPAEGRIEVYSVRPVTQNHPHAPNPHSPPLHHPSLHPFVSPHLLPLLSLSISASFSSLILSFICLSSMLLFHSIIYTPHPLSYPSYLLISSHLISAHSDFSSFPSSCFSSPVSSITYESSHYFVHVVNEEL